MDNEVYAIVDTNGAETIKMPTDPEKEGYLFDGWYCDDGEWDESVSENSLLEAPLSSDIRVYAKWKELHTHTYSIDWTSDEAHHWHECECNDKNNESAHTYSKQAVSAAYIASPATCATKAAYYYSCECGRVDTTVFEYGDALGHSYGEWQTRTAATCTAKGVEFRKCASCTAEETRDTEMLPHDYVDATCTAPRTCKNCPATTGAALGHSWGTPTYTWSADNSKCTARRVCTHDASHVEEEIANSVAKVTQQKSCTADELTKYTATFTNSAFVQQIKENIKTADAFGHSYGEWQKDDNNHWKACGICKEINESSAHGYDNDCDKDCNICGYERTITHDYSSEWKTNGTQHWHECTACGDRKDAANHAFDKTVASDTYKASNATHHAKAKYRYSCECGAVGTEMFEYGEVILHSFVDWQSDDTKHWHECECGDRLTDEAEHTFGANNLCVCGAEKYSKGLDYELVSKMDSETGINTESYKVKGIGTCTDTEIIIPRMYNGKPVMAIDPQAFIGNIVIKSVIIGDNVTSIGDNAFRYCNALTSVTIGNNVTSIAEYAFTNTGLTSITIPSTVTSVGNKAFDSNTLTSATVPMCALGALPQGIETLVITDGETLGSEGLNNYPNLKSITLSSIREIKENTFDNCGSLSSIHFSSNLRTISPLAFDKCGSLTSITIEPSNEKYYAEGNCLIEKSTKKLVLGGNNSQIPSDDGITTIGEYAFAGRGGLKSIVIPSGVTEIETKAFSGCSELTSVIMPSGITKIGTDVFYWCSKLKGNIYDGLAYLGNEENPQLYLLRAIKGFAGKAIVSENCRIIFPSAFVDCMGLKSVVIPSSVTEIPQHTFLRCRNLRSVTLSNCLTKIDSSAFHSCESLTSITIPSSLQDVGNGIFSGCYKLVEIINLSSLDNNKFENDNTLNYKTSGSSDIANVNDYLFYTHNNTNYLLGYVGADKVIELPSLYNGKEYQIYKYAFAYSNIIGVTLPESITTITEHAFYSSNLKSITIPQGVTSIGDLAFRFCEGLFEVVNLSSLTIKKIHRTATWDITHRLSRLAEQATLSVKATICSTRQATSIIWSATRERIKNLFCRALITAGLM